MLQYIARRLLWMVPVLLFVAAITFTLMHLVPGGPWSDNPRLPKAAVERLDAQYGLDDPLWKQFGNFMFNASQGDLGVSYQSLNRPVTGMLLDGIKVSATLGVLALVIAAVLGISLGIIAALRQNTVIDYATLAVATFGASVPAFVVGMLILIVFTVELHWLPSGGWGTPKQLVMPVVALSLLPTAYIARVTRASMLEVLQQDYVRTARAKGLRENVVVLRHMLRNSLIPVLTVLGPVAAALVTGSFVIEYLFFIPGVGRQFVTSIAARDYGLIMGTTLFYAAVVAVANLVVDVLYAVVDPRIRYR